ncbi:WhiB family transcriptional regulator [Streptosporangium saharense]|uniref:WhiB family transcriptional regulator n=1 Tax=Streptosporangium saharense TaxID=1706840 RepID=UPI0033346476
MKGIERAACRKVDSECFFPISYGAHIPEVIEAKKICGDCPILQACLAYALENGETEGIWGGLVPDERRAILLRQTTPSAAPKSDALELRQVLDGHRQRLDWTWHQVAQALDVSDAVLSKLSGGRRMHPDAMERAWAWAAEQDQTAGAPA